MKTFIFTAETSGTCSGYVEARNEKEAMELLEVQKWDDLNDENILKVFNFEIVESYNNEEDEDE